MTEMGLYVLHLKLLHDFDMDSTHAAPNVNHVGGGRVGVGRNTCAINAH